MQESIQTLFQKYIYLKNNLNFFVLRLEIKEGLAFRANF